MLDKIINSKNIIHRALDASWERNRVITQNIANIDTPGYKRQIVTFEDKLRRAMNDRDFNKKDAEKIDIKVREDSASNSMRVDGNNIDIDKEMTHLAQNNIQYETLIKFSGFNSIKAVLDGR